MNHYKGVLEFLDFAFSNALGKEMLPCPCIRCNNCLMHKREIMYDHLLDNGIARNYVRWLMHGEYEFCEPTNTSTNESDMHDEMQEMLNDAFGMPMPNEESEKSRHVHEEFEKPNEDANKFYNLLREVEQDYIQGKSSDEHSTDEFTNSAKKKKIPAKVLRYFPLKPRLQRLYMSSKTTSHMKWHVDGRMEGEMMRHPVDSLAWKNFDNVHPSFALEPQNVRLGLASDGFNPFGNMSISYSMWPVVLIPYNLPPWMCMKQTFFMLSILIPGPTAPGNDIDIYLQPLIDELNDLWDIGVETYDASTKQIFTDQLEHLENDIIVTLCKLERIFPPSFFDVMVHLPIHLASEAKVAGPVQYQWMYPIERYLRTLKSYVRNKSRLEGSIAEGYIAKEYIRVKPRIRARDVDLIHTREFISWFEEREMSHRKGRVQIVSLEDELDNLQLLDIQPATTTTPSSSDPSDSSDPSVVDEERLCHRPPHLSDDDWRWFIHFWGTPEAKNISEKNKANRAKQVIKHTSGSKSYAQIRHEQAQKKEDQSELDRIEMFALTHTRKDGTLVDDHSKEIMVMK
ncbi:hypothetical protein CK203_110934 [Vitis vinifera]|uniref:Transposase-associated domain-containing protein n=1 Tax=Vitis vinifera TaxID=29760 RepID=A0A438CFU3_VITVI|nr:hypothetical protein CK203_110934 [Vitis vinifera]